MERTLVAVFNTKQEAQGAAQALQQYGIPQSCIQVRDESAQEALGSASATQPNQEATSTEPSWWEKIFGGLDTEEVHVSQYTEAIKRGHCIVIVDPITEDRVDEAARILEQYGALDVDERAAQWDQGKGSATLSTQTSAAGAAGSINLSDEGKTRIPVVEEQLEVGKRQVQKGGVRVYTRMSERPVEEQITLREERARVERHAVDRPATEADLGTAFKEGSIEVRETAEQAVVQKTARVVEEVEVEKEASERTETVRDTVRRSDVEVEDLPASGAESGAKPRKRPNP